jgi:hypothetical protein
MAQSETEALTQAVIGLTGEIVGLRTETLELHNYGRENRRLIERQRRIIGFLVAIGIVVAILAVGFGLYAVDAHHTAKVAQQAAMAAERNSVNAQDNCLQANKARQTTRDLWNFALNLQLPTARPLTPQELASRDALIAGLRTRVATAYADQDCSKLGPQPAK